MRRRWMWALASCALLLGALAGCVLRGGGETYRLPSLHIARLQRLDGVSNLSQAASKTTGATLFQQGATLFQQGAAQRILLSVAGQTDRGLAVVDMNGANERQIPLTHRCSSDPAVAPDGQWVACVSSYLPAFPLEVASLSASDSRHWERALTATCCGYQLAWSPDGGYLAVVNQAASPGCGIDVYAAQDSYSQFALVTSVTSPLFLGSRPCQISAVGWSHDGARLLVAVVEGRSGASSLFVDERTPVATLIQHGTSAYTIPAKEFAQVGTAVAAQSQSYNRFAWNPRTDALAFSLSGGGVRDEQLLIYAPGTAQPSALFTLPNPQDFIYGATIYSATWSPDGAKLPLVIGAYQCLDCGVRSLTDVYLYTPPSGP